MGSEAIPAVAKRFMPTVRVIFPSIKKLKLLIRKRCILTCSGRRVASPYIPL